MNNKLSMWPDIIRILNLAYYKITRLETSGAGCRSEEFSQYITQAMGSSTASFIYWLSKVVLAGRENNEKAISLIGKIEGRTSLIYWNLSAPNLVREHNPRISTIYRNIS